MFRLIFLIISFFPVIAHAFTFSAGVGCGTSGASVTTAGCSVGIGTVFYNPNTNSFTKFAQPTYTFSAPWSLFGSTSCNSTPYSVGVCAPSCPSNSTLDSSTGSCSCSAGYNFNQATNTCVSTCPSGTTAQNGQCLSASSACNSVAGTNTASGYVDMGTSPNANMAVGCIPSASGSTYNCMAAFNSSGSQVYTNLVSGVPHYYMQGSYTYLGGANQGMTCTTQNSGIPAASIPNSTCPSGQTLGTFNGQQMCLDSSGTPQSSTPNNPTQSTSAPVTNADGSKTTTTTINNIDGSKTFITNTTYTNGHSVTSCSGSSQGFTPACGVSSPSGTGGSGGTGTTPLPTDAATASNQATQIGIETKIANSLDATGQSTDLSSGTSALSAQETTREANLTGYTSGDHGSGISHFSWGDSSVFPASTGCSNQSLKLGTYTTSIDICTGANMIRDVLGWLVYVLGAWSIINIMLAKPEGSK